MRTELAVIGGGPGGYAAAFLAADLGMEVTLGDSDPHSGHPGPSALATRE
jgi:dihydrolipoamide dehydrogenase